MHGVRRSRFVTFVFAALSAAAPSLARAEGACLKEVDAVAGELRKVTSRRPSTRELVTNWHILTSEPFCIKIGDDTTENVTDIQVVFAKPDLAKKKDEDLGMVVAFKGHFIYPPDDSYTASMVMKDAVEYTDVDDAGEVRRK